MQASLLQNFNSFELFIQMFETAFKIRKSFYLNTPVILNFMEHLFSYLRGIKKTTSNRKNKNY